MVRKARRGETIPQEIVEVKEGDHWNISKGRTMEARGKAVGWGREA